MFGATNLVLNNHLQLFESSDVFAGKHQEFTNLLSKLEGYRQQQEQSTLGLTESKEILREQVENLILRVSVALVALATGTGDANLKKKAKYTPSKLAKVSDPVLCDIAKNMVALATPVLAGLAVYFTTQAELDALQQKTSDFKLAIPQNRVATSSRKASTASIDQLIHSANALLKEEIDALVQPFQFLYPDFYQQYRNARIIIDYTGRKSTTEEPIPDAGVTPD